MSKFNILDEFVEMGEYYLEVVLFKEPDDMTEQELQELIEFAEEGPEDGETFH